MISTNLRHRAECGMADRDAAAELLQDLEITTAAADGAITAKTGTVFVTKATAAALTLANPTATTDDGKILRIMAATAAAHTVTNASGFNDGGSGADVATFGGAKGDNMVIQAYQGRWYVQDLRNVTLG